MKDLENSLSPSGGEEQRESGAKGFIVRHAEIFRLLPAAVCGLLGIVLLLAPLAPMLSGDFTQAGNNFTGYSVFGSTGRQAGVTVPVVLIVVLGVLCVLFAAAAGIFRKIRSSIWCDAVACLFTVTAFATGLGQALWFGSSVGVFSVLCLVIGLIAAAAAVGETVLHARLLSTRDDKTEWKAQYNHWKAWIYLLPALVILAIFTLWPIFNTLRMSMLKDYDGLAQIGGETFEFGFANFAAVASYSKFLTCLGNTMLLTVITVPISTMLALLIAVGLNSIKFLRKTFQTIFFLPYVTNGIAIGMVFMAMFQMIGGGPTTEPISIGIINNIIKAFGGKAINWVNAGSSYWANMSVLIIYIVWNALPFKILVLLGGLQSVNKQYYDAAKVDGASRSRIFWRITVPLLSPMIAYVVITGFIGGFKEYTSIVGIFGDSMGPVGDKGKLNTMVGFIYDNIDQNQGRASAAALILFAIIFVVTMINLYVSKKKVHY